MRVCELSMSGEVDEIARRVIQEGERVLIRLPDGREFFGVPKSYDEDDDVFEETLDERIAASDADIAAGRVYSGDAADIMKAILSDE